MHVDLVGAPGSLPDPARPSRGVTEKGTGPPRRGPSRGVRAGWGPGSPPSATGSRQYVNPGPPSRYQQQQQRLWALSSMKGRCQGAMSSRLPFEIPGPRDAHAVVGACRCPSRTSGTRGSATRCTRNTSATDYRCHSGVESLTRSRGARFAQPSIRALCSRRRMVAGARECSERRSSTLCETALRCGHTPTRACSSNSTTRWRRSRDPGRRTRDRAV